MQYTLNPSSLKAHMHLRVISLNQDTTTGPNYIDECTKLSQEWGHLFLIWTLKTVPWVSGVGGSIVLS